MSLSRMILRYWVGKKVMSEKERPAKPARKHIRRATSLRNVVPVVGDDLFPSWKQLFDTSPVEIRYLGREEVSNSSFHFMAVCEALPIQEMMHRPKQVVICRGNIWGVRWMRQNFPAQFFQFVRRHFRRVWPGAIVLQDDSFAIQ